MSGLILPTAVSPASGWSLIDNLSAAASSVAAAGGLATAEFAQLASEEMWLIDHAVVSCTSAIATAVRWYATSITPGELLDGSNVGNFDVGDWPAGLLLRPSQVLLVQWAGASAGSVGTVRIQYRLYRRS